MSRVQPSSTKTIHEKPQKGLWILLDFLGDYIVDTTARMM